MLAKTIKKVHTVLLEVVRIFSFENKNNSTTLRPLPGSLEAFRFRILHSSLRSGMFHVEPSIFVDSPFHAFLKTHIALL